MILCLHWQVIPFLDESSQLPASENLTLHSTATAAASQTGVTTNAITTQSMDLMVTMAVLPIVTFAGEIAIVTVKSIAREQTWFLLP